MDVMETGSFLTEVGTCVLLTGALIFVAGVVISIILYHADSYYTMHVLISSVVLFLCFTISCIFLCVPAMKVYIPDSSELYKYESRYKIKETCLSNVYWFIPREDT